MSAAMVTSEVTAVRPAKRSAPHATIRGRKVSELALVYTILAVVLVETLYPLLWVLFGSLKTRPDILANVWGPPTRLRWSNYADAWRIAGMGSRIANSAIVTGCALTVLLVTATPCAYAMTRLMVRGRAVALAVIVAAMLAPPQVMAIPLFMTARDLGLINSLPGVALIYAASALPLSIVIMRSFFLTLPADIEEAARIDGASRLQVLFYVVIPLIRPGLALVLIFGFIEIWNDFFLAFLLLREPRVQTIPLGLVSFFQQYDSLWNLYFAALMMTTVPVIVVFLMLQRHFIAGLTAGAVKA